MLVSTGVMELYTLAVVILKLLAVACLATAVAPWLRLKYWWVRIWDFPRPQQAVLAAAVAAALFGLAPAGPLAYALAVSVTLAATHHVAVILPYARRRPRAALRSEQVQKATSNTISTAVPGLEGADLQSKKRRGIRPLKARPERG